ncbi:MAG: protein rep [Clostridia bacterium]
MEFQDLKDISITKEHLMEIINHKEYNKIIISYYERLSEEYSLNLGNQIESISTCNSWWLIDHYVNQKVKDFKKTNLCKDKFCNNCKKVKQASRLSKFMPVIQLMAEDKYIYHLVLTVPNCDGDNLKDTISKMFKNFNYLNRYFNLKKSIKGLDFEQYSYSGAIRSLEVTYNNNSYHPHLHCIIALDKPLNNESNIVNTYSNSKKNGFRKFSDFEILIQKIWFLLNNSERVTKKSIDNLDIGYSCTIDPIDDNSIYEVFKYMTKSTDEKSNILTYDNFKTLYFALYRVRQIQGYGCFYNIKDDDNINDQVDEYYDIIINILKSKEDPIEVSQAPEDLLKDNNNLLISRNKIFKIYRDL